MDQLARTICAGVADAPEWTGLKCFIDARFAMNSLIQIGVNVSATKQSKSMNNQSLDKYHADKCAEEEERQRIENAELYGNIPSNMPPCMMPDGGECCEEYAELNRHKNRLIVELSETKAQVTDAWEVARRLYETLIELDNRMQECRKHPISADEAYDSFYQELMLDAITAYRDHSYNGGKSNG